MRGKIIRGIAGFYDISTGEGRVYRTRARGVFRNLGIKPLVGDDVEFDVISEKDSEGNLVRVLERKNTLLRPAAANIDAALIVFALTDPEPNLNLLDRFLLHMDVQGIPVTAFFNKSDLDPGTLTERYRSVYRNAGCGFLAGSVHTRETEEEIRRFLRGKTTVLAGPSGVGKSSLTNLLFGGERMEVGELSRKIRRGKQTTRHTELFHLEQDTFVLDTPGFTSLEVQGIGAEELQFYYPEFEAFRPDCRFTGCRHLKEGENICAVRRAVKAGSIPMERYENYTQIYYDLKEKERL